MSSTPTSGGEVPEQIDVPAGYGRAFRVRAGQQFEIIDVEGEQVADLCAVAAESHDEHIFLPVTRLALGRAEFRHGDVLLTDRRRGIVRLDDDPVGTHDTLFGICDRYRYEVDFALPPGHRNCRDNFVEALSAEGVSPAHADLAADNGVNIFINQRRDEQGEFHLEAPLTRPGDAARFTALIDAVVAVSACPESQSACNGGRPTPMRIRLL
ncbi:DUF1989 domain-containing protein [Actinomadura syzygii]|uniref:DUF1989 domain-containing protein n=1 Tax=Actinomadura syzygii TaxID=1427538 RepID=UPI001CA35B2B|nr:urea carboxylase-associated family protein [Actinomadura syzygii]